MLPLFEDKVKIQLSTRHSFNAIPLYGQEMVLFIQALHLLLDFYFEISIFLVFIGIYYQLHN